MKENLRTKKKGDDFIICECVRTNGDSRRLWFNISIDRCIAICIFWNVRWRFYCSTIFWTIEFLLSDFYTTNIFSTSSCNVNFFSILWFTWKWEAYTSVYYFYNVKKIRFFSMCQRDQITERFFWFSSLNKVFL